MGTASPLRRPPHSGPNLGGGAVSISGQELAEFASELHGEIVRPQDEGYDDARKIWNAMIDRRPALIVRCRDAEDVTRSIAFARDHELPLAVRGGGHNVSGNALCDDGLVIDLSPLKEVRIDTERRTAVVGGGVTWGEFDKAAQAAGLATTGGVVPATGVAGLTLGGGFGFLARKHGLACDNLLGVELVTADGRLVHASEEENPDLFWGVRGGGGNFGVATSFEFRLHPVGPILGGVAVHPFDRARDALRFYRKFVEGASDEVTLFAALGATPDGSPVTLLVAGYIGPAEDGERILRPLREFGPPIVDDIKRMSYVDLQGILAPSYPPGVRNYWKSGFLSDLSEEAIDTLVRHFERVPSKRTAVVLEYLGGAVSRVGERDTAFGHRDARFDLVITSLWSDPAEDEVNIAWTRELWKAMEPFASGGVYVNYLGEEREEGAERVRAAYDPEKYERLVALKRKYDPENLFRMNQNIRP